MGVPCRLRLDNIRPVDPLIKLGRMRRSGILSWEIIDKDEAEMLVETSLVLQRHAGTPSYRVSFVAQPLSLAVLSIKKFHLSFFSYSTLCAKKRECWVDGIDLLVLHCYSHRPWSVGEIITERYALINCPFDKSFLCLLIGVASSHIVDDPHASSNFLHHCLTILMSLSVTPYASLGLIWSKYCIFCVPFSEKAPFPGLALSYNSNMAYTYLSLTNFILFTPRDGCNLCQRKHGLNLIKLKDEDSLRCSFYAGIPPGLGSIASTLLGC